MIKMFAIQHVPTGHYLPQPKGRGGRGGSYMEPVPASAAFPPRLFHTYQAAKLSLTSWLKGITKVKSCGGWEDDWEELFIEPQPHRKREDMIIVPVHIYLPE